MIATRSIRIAAMFLGTASATLAADDTQKPSPGDFAAVFKVVDLNRDGLIDTSEWRKFEALRVLAEKNLIDTMRPLSVEEIAGSLEIVNNAISSDSNDPPPKTPTARTSPPANVNHSRRQRVRLPAELQPYDGNHDGQISLAEWPRGLRRDFSKLDRNHDGFIEPREVQ